MQPLSLAKDIYPIITRESGRETFMSREMMDGFNVEGSLYKCRWLQFENVIFLNQVFLSNVSLGLGIKFEKCHFQNTFTLNNVMASGEDLVFDATKRSIVFEDCTFDGRFEIIGEKTLIERELNFTRCKFLKGITISGIRTGANGIRIAECEITSCFSIKKCNVEGDICCWTSKINSAVEVEENTVRSFVFSQCNSTAGIFLSKNKFNTGLSFYEGQFEGAVNLESNNGNVLSVIGAIFKKQLEIGHNDFEDIREKKFDNITIENCSFLNGLYFSGKNKLAHLYEITIRSISIKCSPLLQGDIYLGNLRIDYLSLTGFNTKANIVLANMSLYEFLIEDFHNYAQLVLSNIEGAADTLFSIDTKGRFKSNSFHIVRSNLGKANLYRVNFEFFKNIVIKDAVLNEIITSNIVWFDPSRIIVHDEQEQKKNILNAKKNKQPSSYETRQLYKDYAIIRETYRQLKYAMEKNGDRPQALIFKSLEWNYYRKYQRLKEDSNWRDRFVLWTSRSNDFGQNWFKPIWMLLAGSFLLYLPIAFCASNLAFKLSLTKNGIANTVRILFWHELKLWPQLLNPVHNLSNVIENVKVAPGIIYFYDFLLRLITAYFVFQIVTAFRKYVK